MTSFSVRMQRPLKGIRRAVGATLDANRAPFYVQHLNVHPNGTLSYIQHRCGRRRAYGEVAPGTCSCRRQSHYKQVG